MTIITVSAAAGLKVPMEHDPRTYITELPVAVEDSAYYRRRMAEGDLRLATSPAPSPKKGKE